MEEEYTYGFHGLLCESVPEQLRARQTSAPQGRVLIAHLGNGAITAVCAGVEHLGVDIAAERNASEPAIISRPRGLVVAPVMKTDRISSSPATFDACLG